MKNDSYIKVENITGYIHKIYIPVDTDKPHTIDLIFKDVKTGDGFGMGMSAGALMEVMRKHWDNDITLAV